MDEECKRADEASKCLERMLPLHVLNSFEMLQWFLRWGGTCAETTERREIITECFTKITTLWTTYGQSIPVSYSGIYIRYYAMFAKLYKSIIDKPTFDKNDTAAVEEMTKQWKMLTLDQFVLLQVYVRAKKTNL